MVDPDLRLLYEIVVEDCPRYWSVAPGDAGLFYERAGARAQLVLLFSPAAGYFLTYQKAGEDDEYTLERVGGGAEEVTADLGGEPIAVARRHFATPTEAWSVVARFAKTGEMGEAPSGMRWVVY